MPIFVLGLVTLVCGAQVLIRGVSFLLFALALDGGISRLDGALLFGH